MGYAPFVSQIITLRSLSFNLAQLNGKYADYLLERYKELISHPLLYSEAKRLSTIAFPQLKDSTYALPEGPATEVFRNVIKNHAGKFCLLTSGQRIVDLAVLALNKWPIYANNTKIILIFSSYSSQVMTKVPKKLIINM